ncbi:RNA polymerase sigma factor [Pseudarthrobacter sp. NPDC092424]|uniref:RNA polymerase sigma factor n=1 Tax=Pseudarthrobacter sp. NPDC092424 TaxID=3364415 RepID=UPI00382AF0E2
MLSERELAFIALYKDKYPRIHKYVARRVEDAELAQELAADVFRVAWQKWDGTGPTEVSWLLTVTRNLIGNAYRARDRRRALHERLSLTPVTCPSGEGDRDITAVEEAMAALREKDRDILQLAYWDELTIAEIAQVLQCTQSTAKVRLHRAREAFRKLVPALCGHFDQKVGA